MSLFSDMNELSLQNAIGALEVAQRRGDAREIAFRQKEVRDAQYWVDRDRYHAIHNSMNQRVEKTADSSGHIPGSIPWITAHM